MTKSATAMAPTKDYYYKKRGKFTEWSVNSLRVNLGIRASTDKEILMGTYESGHFTFIFGGTFLENLGKDIL